MKKIHVYQLAVLLLYFFMPNGCSKTDISPQSSSDQISLAEKNVQEVGLSANNGNGNTIISGGGIYDAGVYIGEEHLTHFSLDAILKKDGSAQGHLVYRSEDLDVWGDIDCINVQGGLAKLSGVITKVRADQDLSLYYYVGARFSFNVGDTGEGANAPPDRTSGISALSNGQDCTNMPGLTIYPITNGNIQIKP